MWLGATVSALAATIFVTVALLGALLLGRWLHDFLPDHHLSADSKDAVKLAMGLVATMTALLLGLLVSSAKSNYDAQRGQVIQMAAKVAFLDRLLSLYGRRDEGRPDGAARGGPDGDPTGVAGGRVAARELAPDEQGGDAVYAALQRLVPRDDVQRTLKTQATSLTLELAAAPHAAPRAVDAVRVG